MKTCPKCERVLPIDGFHRNRSMPDGRAAWCKPCMIRASGDWRQRNRERVRQNERCRRAENPEKARAYGREWYRQNIDKIRAKTLRQYRANPERAKEAARRWRQENPERLRAATQAWRRANPERHAERQRYREAVKREATIAPFSAADLRARLSMFPGCWVCGDEATQVDHVKPLARGGAHCLSNLRPICGHCNATKHARWPFPIPTAKRKRAA